VAALEKIIAQRLVNIMAKGFARNHTQQDRKSLVKFERF